MEQMPTPSEIFTAANQIFNVLLPMMPIVLGAGLLLNLVNRIFGDLGSGNSRYSLGSEPSPDPVPSDDPPKPKRGAMFIPATDEYILVPEKPKRKIVRIGDDGELLYEAENYDE
jgi:hypothetical protein